MEDQPYVYCGRWNKHQAHGPTCPGTGKCGERDVHEPHLVLDGSLGPYWCFGSRIRIYREQKVTIDGRKLVGTWWEGEVLPVMQMPDDEAVREGHSGSEIVGYIEKVQRETSTGWVTALLVLYKPRDVSGWAAEADFSIYEPVSAPGENGDVLVMNNAKLRGVTIGHRPTWDEMVIP